MKEYTEEQLKIWEVVNYIYTSEKKIPQIEVSEFITHLKNESSFPTLMVSLSISESHVTFTTSKEFGIWNFTGEMPISEILQNLKSILRDHKIDNLLNN
jgi:hypothetical protein